MNAKTSRLLRQWARCEPQMSYRGLKTIWRRWDRGTRGKMRPALKAFICTKASGAAATSPVSVQGS